MKPTNSISALLITYNEVHHIDEAIQSVSFADEIIVVDSFSTDGTREKLATYKNVKTICHPFENFTAQRNFAIQQASCQWILFIDADERIPLKLKNEIIKEINSDKNIAGYMFKRIFFFKKKRIRFSGFQSDTTYRLFKNGLVTYTENKLVHEMPIIKGRSKLLKNNMPHYCFESAQHYKSKMEQYATLKAQELYSHGKKATVFHVVFRPLYKFLVNYIFRLGFLDGKEGLQLCYLSAYGVFFRYKKLKQLHLKNITS